MSHLLTLDSVSEKKEEELSFSFWNWWNYVFLKVYYFVVSGLISVIQLNLFQVSLS